MPKIEWYKLLPLLPVIYVFLPGLVNVSGDLYGRVDLNFFFFTWNFQSLTITFTSLLFLTVYIVLVNKVKFINNVIISVATTVLATHFYEMVHALSQLYVTGSTGMTLWILNIPVVVWLSIFLYFFGKKLHLFTFHPLQIPLFVLFCLSFYYLISTNFFQNPNLKGFAWALTKIINYTMWIPLFVGEKKQ